MSKSQKKQISETLKETNFSQEAREQYIERFLLDNPTCVASSKTEKELTRLLVENGIEVKSQFPLVVDADFYKANKKANKMAYIYDFKVKS